MRVTSIKGMKTIDLISVAVYLYLLHKQALIYKLEHISRFCFPNVNHIYKEIVNYIELMNSCLSPYRPIV